MFYMLAIVIVLNQPTPLKVEFANKKSCDAAVAQLYDKASVAGSNSQVEIAYCAAKELY